MHNLATWFPTIAAQSAQELIRSGQRSYSFGIACGQAAFLVCAGMFVYGAYKTVKDGFKITKTRTVRGTSAKIIAATFLVAAVAVAVFAVVVFPRLELGL
jgi:TRAP-type C4-dicarboxylate transport system permease small subunit